MGGIVPEAIERYLAGLNRMPGALGEGTVLEGNVLEGNILESNVLADTARVGREQHLPLVDAEVGALLRVLAVAAKATRILEIGTAIGYSGIWLAGALPRGGMLLTMEMDAARAKQAQDNFVKAGCADRASVMVGNAALLLAKVSGPFDLIFQDGDKQLYSPLLDRLVALLRPGGLLVTDNVLWGGEVVPGFVDPPTHDPDDTRAIADYNERLSTHPHLLTAIVPLRDGVAISVKKR
jgi:predicted O-methyltransferase YrrM